MMTETRTVTTNGTAYSYLFTRKRVKNFNLRVKEDGTVLVSAPVSASLARVDAFVLANAAFIDRARKKLRERQAAAPAPLTLVTGDVLPIWGVLHTVVLLTGKKREAKRENGQLLLTVKDPASMAERHRCFTDFLDREAKETLTARTAALTPLFAPKPSSPPLLTFRTMKSKWGVCRPREHRVTLNRNLVYLPPALADYVICHELAHFHHADHSAAFWQTLAAVLPEYRSLRRALNAYPLPVLSQPE